LNHLDIKATQFGLSTVWVNQYNETKESLPAAAYEVKSLADLPDLLDNV